MWWRCNRKKRNETTPIRTLLTAALLAVLPALAQAETCSNAGMGTLLKFDFNSAFPLRIMGQTVMSGNDVPHPPGATSKSICKCGKEPYVVYGYTRGMWLLPPRFVEVVAKPPAAPVYGSSVKPLLSQLAKVNGQAAQPLKPAPI